MLKKINFLLMLAIFLLCLTVAGTGEAAEQDVSRDPADFSPYGGALNRTEPTTVNITLYAHERIGTLHKGADGAVGGGDDILYNFFTFGHSADPATGMMPGPFIRVLEGDTVNFTLVNPATNSNTHSIDLHAVKGYRGGSSALMANPGISATLTFSVLNPGLFMYHCVGNGTVISAARHVANGMSGLILVVPREEGADFKNDLAIANKEYYIMRNEFYTTTTTPGETGDIDLTKGLEENPDYVVFNGRDGALIDKPLTPDQFDTVIIYFGNIGPNQVASMHMIGDIWDREYQQGDVLSAPKRNIQTSVVPAAGAAIWAFQVLVGGSSVLLDHAIFRVAKGALGIMAVQ